jgi:uncharacterized protein YbcI
MAQRAYDEGMFETKGSRLRLFDPLCNPIIVLPDGRTMEIAIRNAIIKFEQEFMGRGPDEVRAFVVRDLVVVRLKGVLTPAERQLAKTAEGIEMVKRLRQNLIAQGRDKLCEQVSEITGAKILGVFTDIDVQLGERVFVFTMDRDIHTSGR